MKIRSEIPLSHFVIILFIKDITGNTEYKAARTAPAPLKLTSQFDGDSLSLCEDKHPEFLSLDLVPFAWLFSNASDE